MARPVKSTRPSRARTAPKGGAEANRNARLAGFEEAELRRLIELVQQTGIGELEVTSRDRTVRVSALPGGGVRVTSPGLAEGGAPQGGAPLAPERAKAEAPPEKRAAVTSPMVGTFYRAPAPDADPYVEVGSSVDVGQTVCIIEAMKLMNEIESEVKGRVVEILVENAQPVEFGQKLFLVEPA